MAQEVGGGRWDSENGPRRRNGPELGAMRVGAGAGCEERTGRCDQASGKAWTGGSDESCKTSARVLTKRGNAGRGESVQGPGRNLKEKRYADHSRGSTGELEHVHEPK